MTFVVVEALKSQDYLPYAEGLLSLRVTSKHIKGPFSLVYLLLISQLLRQHGHELSSLSFWRAYLWMFHMQDTSCDHSFYDVSSKFTFIFFTIFIIVSHLVMDRLSTANTVVHISSMLCKVIHCLKVRSFSLHITSTG